MGQINPGSILAGAEYWLSSKPGDKDLGSQQDTMLKMSQI